MQKTILAVLLTFACLSASAQRNRKVKVITDYGTMTIRLYDQTPLHRDNFIKLVKKHFYDSLLFHRVIANFMIQGGDPDSKRAAAEIKTKGLTNHIFAGEYHSAFKGRGMSFSEVRDYQFGDDVRSIDWNVTARFNHPFVKIFEEERELTVMLLVDMSESESFGTAAHTKRSLVTELCAVLAFYHVFLANDHFVDLHVEEVYECAGLVDLVVELTDVVRCIFHVITIQGC